MSKKKPPSERRNPPPVNRVPENTGGQAYYEVDQIHVASWNPLPDGKGASTQVHMSISVRQLPVPLVMRFKGPGTLSALIGSLERHRNDVWPAGEAQAGVPPPRPEVFTSDATGVAERLWEQYEAGLVPADADADQRRVLREAYRAGMNAMLATVEAIGEPDVPEARGVEILESIKQELKRP